MKIEISYNQYIGHTLSFRYDMRCFNLEIGESLINKLSLRSGMNDYIKPKDIGDALIKIKKYLCKYDLETLLVIFPEIEGLIRKEKINRLERHLIHDGNIF